MKKILLGEILVLFLLLSLVAYLRPIFLLTGQKQTLFSPLPDFLTIIRNREVLSFDLLVPSLDDVAKSNIQKPQISARSALIYDLTTKQAIFVKNPKERLPLASLTKIMTAIIAIENPKKDDKYVVRKEDLVGEDNMGLSVGETYSLDELLYGLMLHSANDAAEVLANNYPGERTAFIKAMNSKVKALGLKDTNFTNPSGLEGDGDQYTTAYDLLVITAFAQTNFPKLRQITSTFDYHIPYSSDHKEIFLENETNLLTSYPGVKGVKTGYTPEAGLCLSTYLEYGGHKIIGIILNSENRRDEMKELLDYSLKTLGVEPPAHG